MKKSLRKKIIAMVLAATLCMASGLVVSANSSPSNDGHWEIVYLNESEVRSVGNLIDSGGTVTSGYGTTITLTMDRAYYAPYFRAAATGNANNAVACDLTFPNGSSYDLGAIVANGQKTPYLHYTGTAPAGDYVFSFQGTDSGTTGFAAFMYSDY